MKIYDKIYGSTVIDDNVLIELIKSKPVQRLKRISQAGASRYVLKGRDTNRYDHSIGVMILLRKLNASIEEQIAGLLHDVPHTAFSHVVDYVFRSEAHDYHERFHEEIVLNSAIPKILKKYNYDVNHIIHTENFPLLERDSPDLCADRLDYALRDRLAMFNDVNKLRDYVPMFIVKDSEIIFNNRQGAISFALDYLEMADLSWSSNFEGLLYEILAKAIKIALDKNIISEKELFTDDKFVFRKLKKSKDKEILSQLKLMNKNLKYVEDKDHYDYYIKNKLRYIDPKFTESNKIRRVSDASKEFNLKLETHKKLVKKGAYIRIIN